MACDKCFTFMESFYRQTELMSDEQALRFYNGMCMYVFDGKAPDFDDDLVLKVAWVSVSAAIDNNLKSRANGKKGGRPRKETGDKTPLKPHPTLALIPSLKLLMVIQKPPLKPPLNQRK